MAEPVLAERALNRALLARQLLLERVDLPIPEALGRLCGIQNQYAPNAYLRLWSCLAGFRRDDLTRAYEDGSVVQGTLMRGTIHAVAATDYPALRAAVAPILATWADRLHRTAGADRSGAVARVRAALARGPLRRPELLAVLADEPPAARQSIDTDAGILRVPPSGTWVRRRADLCALADTVVGEVAVDAAAGLRVLVTRYLAGFGPATAADVASFCGMTVSGAREVLDGLELRRFRSADGDALLDVPDGLLPAAETAAPVRFLPTWDATLLVHARRTQILPEAYRPMIFHTKMPPSYPTLLVDGQVAGTWRFVDDEIRIEAFAPIPSEHRAAVDAEAGRLAAFHAGTE